MEAFAILSDPVRRRILEQLCQQEMSSGEVVSSVGQEFGITQSAISQQLKVLRDNQFAAVRADGTKRIYSLDARGFRSIDQWLDPFKRFWGPKFEALAREVECGPTR